MAIELIPSPNKSILQEEPDYLVILDNQVWGKLHYNMVGYVGYLPTPEGRKLSIGEKSLGTYKKEIAKLNREFRSRSKK